MAERELAHGGASLGPRAPRAPLHRRAGDAPPAERMPSRHPHVARVLVGVGAVVQLVERALFVLRELAQLDDGAGLEADGASGGEALVASDDGAIASDEQGLAEAEGGDA